MDDELPVDGLRRGGGHQVSSIKQGQLP
jgi:hypothetical protein